jgi:cation diffusion facilitator family transporter
MTGEGPLRPALVTVAVATVLFVAKLVVALASDSVGLLSTAIDSALDLGMSLVVLGGVVLARRPADRDHPYGHGKFESVTGLLEAGVLAAIGVLVVYVGIQRIQDPRVVTLDGWMVAVLVASMLVGAERGLSLRKQGREHDSPALSVDAWHYASDVATAGLGLVGAWAASAGYAWADGASAVLVGGFLVAGSLHVGREATADLVDRVPPSLVSRVEDAVEGVEDVEEATQVRVRGSGPNVFVDATVQVPRAMGIERAHDVMDEVELAVQAEIGQADVTVHAEPIAARETAIAELKVMAARDPEVLGIHEILVDRIEEALYVDCHVEVDQALSLSEGHAIAQRFEERVKRQVDGVAGIRTHIEPAPRDARRGEDVTDEHADVVDEVRAAIEDGPFEGAGSIALKRAHGNLEAVLTALLAGDVGLEPAHDAAHDLEHELLSRVPELDRVVVHLEPVDEPEPR